jgi:predicted P-loop ATPase
LGTKDAQQQIATAWIHEIAELGSVLRASPEAVKAFLTAREDRFRPAYGARVVCRPRQCVFAGTVNPNGFGYLSDDTGNRRFWPAAVGRVWLDAIREDLAQLWAEAQVRYLRGEPWHLSAEHQAVARSEQTRRETDDPWCDAVMHVVMGRGEDPIALEEVWRALELPASQRDRRAMLRVGRILRQLGGGGDSTLIKRAGQVYRAVRPAGRWPEGNRD